LVWRAATPVGFSAGLAPVPSGKNGAMTLYKAESPSIAVTDGAATTVAPLAVTVASATATKSRPPAATTTPVAGEADNLTVSAQDTYGNVATAYTGSHDLTFSGASASP